MTTGFYGGDFVIVAARPAMGKTSLVMNMALNVAQQNIGNVAVFQLGNVGDPVDAEDGGDAREGSDGGVEEPEFESGRLPKASGRRGDTLFVAAPH